VKEKLSVEVKGLVTELPKEIRVDLTKLQEIHDKILFRDLVVGKGLELLEDPEEVIVAVTLPQAVEEELEQPVEAAEPAEVAGEEAEEPEEEEKEEEGKEKGKGKEGRKEGEKEGEKKEGKAN